MKSDRDPIQEFCLMSESNLRIASAVGDAWPEARGKLVTGFLDRLNGGLMKKLKGWQSTHDEGVAFFNKPYPGYWLWKPAWKDQYSIRLECFDYGKKMVFGVGRAAHFIGKRPPCQDLFDAFQQAHASATAHKWWEARTIMRSPAPDWRKPEVLWRMHRDDAFLQEVVAQLLDVASASEDFVDKLVQG